MKTGNEDKYNKKLLDQSVTGRNGKEIEDKYKGNLNSICN
jgi:hypothetical protein